MSLVAKMKEQYSKGGGMTPEQHKIFLRAQKEKEEEAIRIAKARAARYNMTLRSRALSIKGEFKSRTEDVKPARPANIVKGTTNDDYKKKLAPKEDVAPKLYTLRAVQTTVQVQEKVGEALNHRRSPSVAKALVETAATNLVDELQKEEVVIKRKTIVASMPASSTRESTTAARAPSVTAARAASVTAARAGSVAQPRPSIVAAAAAASVAPPVAPDDEVPAHPQLWGSVAETVMAEIAKDEAMEKQAAKEEEEVFKVLQDAKVEITPEIETFIQTEDSPSVVGQEFEMSSLKKAIESDDQAAINKAVVEEFLDAHAPDEKANVDKLMENTKTDEDVAQLMETLAEKYPDPAEAIEKAAMEEIRVAESGEQVEKAAPKNEEENILEQQRAEAERVAAEEAERIASMDDEERAIYDAKQAALAAHSEKKDQMLKNQLNIYSSGGTKGAAHAIMGGKGRGRGRGKAATSRAPTEFIVKAVNTDGEWQVNPEDEDDTAAE